MGIPSEPFFITNCPKCQFRRQLAAQYLGYSLRCRQCGEAFTVANTGARPIDDPIRFSLEFNSAVEQANVPEDFSEDFAAKRPR